MRTELDLVMLWQAYNQIDIYMRQTGYIKEIAVKLIIISLESFDAYRAVISQFFYFLLVTTLVAILIFIPSYSITSTSERVVYISILLINGLCFRVCYWLNPNFFRNKISAFLVEFKGTFG